MYISARQLLGSPVTTRSQSAASVTGTIETITINPKIMVIDGFLVGRVGLAANQLFLPRECVVDVREHAIYANGRLVKKAADSRRILGLSAWTTHPKMLVGFVYDVYFSLENGSIESFVIHQLIRTWRIPATSVEKITPRSLLIDNDTTIKLKMTPYPSE